ncbi:MAG: molecular chaperone TorD family protein [Alphaproteobacteria bacterium]|nr:molecular chaperone TorD family protein [Alphaproteobacteria bacterium]
METSRKTDLIEIEDPAAGAMERSQLYGFLAAVFRSEPTLDLLREIRKPDFKAALKAAGVDMESIFGGKPDGELISELAVEYARLFIGPGHHIAPYATLYFGDMGASLWGPVTSWVKGFIEEAGFDYKPDFHDLPDHVSVELEFMQEITSRLAQARENGNDDGVLELHRIENEFLITHLGKWLPEFCDKIEAEAQLPFFAQMALLTKNFLAEETTHAMTLSA